MARVVRYFVGRKNGIFNCTFWDKGINQLSLVMVSVSEGDDANTTNSPARFIGEANLSVLSVAPFDGGVTFRLKVDWGSPVAVWADIFVADEDPQGWVK